MRLLPVILIYVVLDIYMYQTFNGYIDGRLSKQVFQFVYFLISALCYFSFFKVERAISKRTIFQSSGINMFIGFLISVLVAKLIYGILLFAYDIFRAVVSLFQEGWIARYDIIVLAIAIIALLIFLLMIHGSTFGKYNYKVERLTLSFPDLPKSFDGYKIVQISDLHVGSYDNSKGLLKGIKLMDNEEPDLIVFTGDMVNDHKDEMIPFIDDLKKIKAKDGVYAVLGNHDYYAAYRQKDKDDYWRDFFQKFEQIGFKLLNNESVLIHNGNESLRLVGSENWGGAGWAPKRGDLDQAFSMVAATDFSILLTHDPSHWDKQVLRFPKKVQLSLSGHTHGFQFGINLPFFKWSPAQYSYPRWIGLYIEQDQYLYVNRGFGYIAYPGRVGMRPEITVLTLKCS